MNKIIFTICLTLFFTFPLMADESDVSAIMHKHGLDLNKNTTWYSVSLSDKTNLKSDAGKVQWIMAVGQEKVSDAKEYARYSGVGRLLAKNQRLFAGLLSLEENYRKTIQRMDEVYDASLKLYNKKLPSERATKVKYKILIKIRSHYEALREHSTKIYSQAVRVEQVLKQLVEPVQEAYSFSVINEAMATEFAESFNAQSLKLEEKSILSGLNQTEKEIQQLLAESEKVYNEAMKNLKI